MCPIGIRSHFGSSQFGSGALHSRMDLMEESQKPEARDPFITRILSQHSMSDDLEDENSIVDVDANGRIANEDSNDDFDDTLPKGEVQTEASDSLDVKIFGQQFQVSCQNGTPIIQQLKETAQREGGLQSDSFL